MGLVGRRESDLQMREEGALFFGGEGVAVDFEDATGEGFELLGGDFDDAAAFAPLDHGEAPGFVFEDDIGEGFAHGTQGATGFLMRSESGRFFYGRRRRGGHETDVGRLFDEGKPGALDGLIWPN